MSDIDTNSKKYISIRDYNIHISNNKYKYNIEEYFRLIHSYFYSHVDISIMNQYMQFSINEKDFNINIETLERFNLLKNLQESSIKSFFTEYNLKINLDYRIFTSTIIGKLNNEIQLKEYKLTPQAFKYCLLFSQQKVYIQYFLIVESIYYNYSEYELLFLANRKNDTIDYMENKFKEFNTEINNKLDNNISKLISKVDEMSKIINQYNDHYVKLNTDINLLCENVSEISETIDKKNKDHKNNDNIRFSEINDNIKTYQNDIIKYKTESDEINKSNFDSIYKKLNDIYNKRQKFLGLI